LNVEKEIKNIVNLERLKIKHYNNQIVNNKISLLRKMRNMHNIKNPNINTNNVNNIDIEQISGEFY
jgi:hypothetical protein